MSNPSPHPSPRSLRVCWSYGWTLERVLFAIAGAAGLLGSVLGALVSPWFFALTGFVALNQLALATTGLCGASALLRRTTTLTTANDA